MPALKLRSVGIALFVLVALALTYVAWGPVLAADKPGPQKMLAHNVYFALNEPTPANVQKLIDACHKYLSKHPGTVFYCAGSLSDLDRPVNDREWDVGLHVIFQDRAAHDAYQVHPEHLKFIEENKSSWKKVRVFDTDATKG